MSLGELKIEFATPFPSIVFVYRIFFSSLRQMAARDDGHLLFPEVALRHTYAKNRTPGLLASF